MADDDYPLMTPSAERKWNVEHAPELKTVTPDDSMYRDEVHGTMRGPERGSSSLWTHTPRLYPGGQEGTTPRPTAHDPDRPTAFSAGAEEAY